MCATAEAGPEREKKKKGQRNTNTQDMSTSPSQKRKNTQRATARPSEKWSLPLERPPAQWQQQSHKHSAEYSHGAHSNYTLRYLALGDNKWKQAAPKRKYLFNEDDNAAVFLNQLPCATFASSLHVGPTLVRCLLCNVSAGRFCWEGVGPLLKAEKSCCAGGENTVRRGYFHDPISIREAKLFMWSA